MEGVLAGPVERMDLARDLNAILLSTIGAEKNLIVAGSNVEERSRYDGDILKNRAVFTSQLDKLDAMATPDGKKLITALRGTREEWLAVSDKIRTLAHDNKLDEAATLSVGRAQELDAIRVKQVEDYIGFEQQILAQAPRRGSASVQSDRLLLIGVTLTSLVAGAGAAFWIAFAISRGLARSTSLAKYRRPRRSQPGGRGEKQRRDQRHGRRAQSHDRKSARHRQYRR